MKTPAPAPVSTFPAILVAGRPHCGKSVLSYMLSQHLRRMGIAHYLLRAAPDGEGDWFLNGDPAFVRTLRNRAKGAFTAEFVAHMKSTIENRLLPLLVDAGGLPQDEQFGIIRACTAAIVLYKQPEGSAMWDEILDEFGIPLIARLQSLRQGSGYVQQTTPFLLGTISGLERSNPTPDLTFGALLERIAGIFNYPEAYLEAIHLRYAQYPPVSERVLMKQIDPAFDGQTVPQWQPQHLEAVRSLIPAGKALSLYGRGPVWLAAAIAAHAAPAPMSIYDARFGWLPLPEVQECTHPTHLHATLHPQGEAEVAEIRIPGGQLEPETLTCPPLGGETGLVLSGKLPRWAFAALARHLQPRRPWLAVYDPRTNTAIPITAAPSA